MDTIDKQKTRPEDARSTELSRPEEATTAAASEVFTPEVLMSQEPMAQDEPAKTSQLYDVLRFKWTIAAVFILVAGPVIAGIWAFTVPLYRASAVVRVKPIIQQVVFETEETGRIPLYKSFLNTQVAIIRSPGVLERVLDQPDVQQTQWYQNPQKTMLKQVSSPIERLMASLQVRPRSRTENIDVQLMARDPKESVILVNAVLDQYIGYIAETSDQSKDNVYRLVTEQYKSLEIELQGRREILAELRRELGTSNPQELVSSKRLRLDAIQAKLEDVQRQVKMLDWQYKELTSQAPEDSDQTVEPASPNNKTTWYHQDPEWRSLNLQLKTIGHRVAAAKKHYTPKHSRMIAILSEEKFAGDLLAERQAQLNEQWQEHGGPPPTTAVVGSGYHFNLSTLHRQLKLVKQQEKLLTEDVQRQLDDFKVTSHNAELLARENDIFEHKQQLFETVRERLAQKDMERNVPGSVEILNRAFAPSTPNKDRRVPLTLMAIAGALGLGVVAAFLRTSVSQAMHGAEDLPTVLRTPFLGQIPLVRKLDSTVEQTPMMVESMRMVRTALLSRLSTSHGNVVMLSSADSGVGKSTVAALMAKSLAKSGKKVLLVDADMRKMSITKRFDLMGMPGLAESLESKSVKLESIFPTDTTGLWIMPAGDCVDSFVPELMTNGAFGACVKKLRQEYDIVLLDAPPLLPVADARILSTQVDGTIMLVREEKCRRRDVVDALAHLGSSGGKLLGTIFIGSGRRRGYYRSDYYYGYGGSNN